MLRQATSASVINWKPATPWVIALMPTVVMAGLTLNGLVPGVVANWIARGPHAAFFGINPFDLVVLAVAVYVSASHARDVFGERLGWAEIMAATAVLVPSSAVAWLALACYAGRRSLTTRAEPRTAALLCLVLALASLWSSVAIEWLAVPLTRAEASVVWTILSHFRDDITLMDNVISLPDGSKLALLSGIATAVLLPKALIAVAALAVLFDAAKPVRLTIALSAVALVLALGNWGLIAVMAAYPIDLVAPGTIGASLFELFQGLIVLGAGWWLGRRT
jgi:hypothetical protein